MSDRDLGAILARHQPRPSAQPSLLAELERAERAPRKIVRAVSKQLYAALRDGDYLPQSSAKVLRNVAAFKNRRGSWPTGSELTAWMFEHGEIPRNDTRFVVARVTELVKGRVVRRATGESVRVGGGVLVLLPVRVCHVTGNPAHPISVREAGSDEREVQEGA